MSSQGVMETQKAHKGRTAANPSTFPGLRVEGGRLEITMEWGL